MLNTVHKFLTREQCDQKWVQGSFTGLLGEPHKGHFYSLLSVKSKAKVSRSFKVVEESGLSRTKVIPSLVISS